MARIPGLPSDVYFGSIGDAPLLKEWPAQSRVGDDQDDEHELGEEERRELVGILGFDPREADSPQV